MGCFDDLDASTGHTVVVSGDDQAREFTWPIVLDSASHSRRSFSGADRHCPPRRWFRQVRWHAFQWIGGGNGSVEHGTQQLGWIIDRHSRNSSRTGGDLSNANDFTRIHDVTRIEGRFHRAHDANSFAVFSG